MNSSITTLDPVTRPAHLQTILAEHGITCSLISLEPGAETPLRATTDVDEHLLFVVEGEATVRVTEVNTILEKDQALHIAAGREHVIAANFTGPVKLLRVDIPPRQIVSPPIVSFER
ncbi:MAG: cupin domain-containing protein [Opitutus sp.]